MSLSARRASAINIRIGDTTDKWNVPLFQDSHTTYVWKTQLSPSTSSVRRGLPRAAKTHALETFRKLGGAKVNASPIDSLRNYRAGSSRPSMPRKAKTRALEVIQNIIEQERSEI